MFVERLQFQKFIVLSLLAHLIFAGLLSTVRISVPIPADRPLRIRIVNQPKPSAIRPPLDHRNLGQFSSRAQRPAGKEGPARTPASSLRPNLESRSPRAALSLPPPPRQGTPAAPAPRALPAPSIPAVPAAPSVLADLSAPTPAPAPRALSTPSIPPPRLVSPPPASTAGKAVPALPGAIAAPQGPSPPAPSPLVQRGEHEGKQIGSGGAVKGAPAGRAGASEPRVTQGGRSSGDGNEGAARPYDLRGQVAMLWKNLDPSKYPYQDADTGEEGETGSTTERTISLDSQDSRFASYLLGVKRRIENIWDYPPEARGLTGNLVVTFGITRDGRLSDLQLIETSGIAPLDNEAIRAIREAAPFAPFPERMKYERLNIRAAFYYYASRAGFKGR